MLSRVTRGSRRIPTCRYCFVNRRPALYSRPILCRYDLERRTNSDFASANKERAGGIPSEHLSIPNQKSTKKTRQSTTSPYTEDVSDAALLQGAWDTSRPINDYDPGEMRPSYLDAEGPRQTDPFEGLSNHEDPSRYHYRGKPSAETEFHHSLIRQEPLKVNALGKVVDALIVRNPNQLRKKKPKVIIVEDEETTPAPELSWQEVLREDEDLAESQVTEEVMQNIESLRPTESNIIRKKELDKLAMDLVQGFTQAQLMQYFNTNAERQRTTSDPSPYSWIKQKGTWQAASPMEAEVLTPKQRHAHLILQLVWGLEVSEQVEGLGRTPVWVGQTVLELLNRKCIGQITSSPILG